MRDGVSSGVHFGLTSGVIPTLGLIGGSVTFATHFVGPAVARIFGAPGLGA